MLKENKATVIWMCVGVVFIATFDIIENYIARSWYPYDALLALKDTLYNIEWIVIGLLVSFLAVGGQIKHKKLTIPYLIVAIIFLLMTLLEKKIYGISLIESINQLSASMNWPAIMIPTQWCLIVAGVFLFKGLFEGKAVALNEKRIFIISIGVAFILIMFLMRMLDFVILNNTNLNNINNLSSSLYSGMDIIRFLLLGITTGIIFDSASVFNRPNSQIKSAVICLLAAFIFFLLTGAGVYYSLGVHGIIMNLCNAASFILANYAGVLLITALNKTRKSW